MSQSQYAQTLSLAQFTKLATIKRLKNHGRLAEVFLFNQSLGFVDAMGYAGMRQAHKAEVNNALFANSQGAPEFLARPLPSAQAVGEYPELASLRPVEFSLASQQPISSDGHDVDIVQVASLDISAAEQYSKPWLCQHCDGQVVEFDTEVAACEYQQVHRVRNNLNPTTGESTTNGVQMLVEQYTLSNRQDDESKAKDRVLALNVPLAQALANAGFGAVTIEFDGHHYALSKVDEEHVVVLCAPGLNPSFKEDGSRLVDFDEISDEQFNVIADSIEDFIANPRFLENPPPVPYFGDVRFSDWDYLAESDNHWTSITVAE